MAVEEEAEQAIKELGGTFVKGQRINVEVRMKVLLKRVIQRHLKKFCIFIKYLAVFTVTCQPKA